MVSASTSSIAKPWNPASFRENHGCRDDRPEQRPAANFVHPCNHFGAACPRSPFVAVSAHQRFEHAHLACSRGKVTLQRFRVYEIVLNFPRRTALLGEKRYRD
jgi:hypothetical protein